MPLTQIDTVAALVVIDMQKGVVALPTVHPVADIIERIAQLAREFRRHGLPVVLVNVAARAPGRTNARSNVSFQADWAELIPELERQPGDYAVTKMQVGAFYGTALDQILRRRAATQIFLTGISTSSGVEATARAGYDYGYNVVLVTDAMTDLNADAHHHSVESTFPRLGETSDTADVLELLKQRT